MRILLALALVLATPIDRADDFRALQAIDLRLAAIAHRLVTANAALCADKQPGLGMTIQSLGQFDPDARDDARAVFGFEAPIAVEGVAADGPAARAGVAAGDSVVAINGDPITGVAPTDEAISAARDRVDDRLAALPPTAPVTLTLLREGRQRVATVAPTAACRSRFEVMLGDGYTAEADGRVVQIGARYLEEFGDTGTAVIAAHELAHNILRHRARLDAAKVDRGLLSELGRNGRLFRQTEQEADRLSVYLLYNAGYDPAEAARFWRGGGDKIDGGLFRSRTHYGAKTRAKQIEDEAALIPTGAVRPVVPAMLRVRDQPL